SVVWLDVVADNGAALGTTKSSLLGIRTLWRKGYAWKNFTNCFCVVANSEGHAAIGISAVEGFLGLVARLELESSISTTTSIRAPSGSYLNSVLCRSDGCRLCCEWILICTGAVDGGHQCTNLSGIHGELAPMVIPVIQHDRSQDCTNRHCHHFPIAI